MGLPTGFAGPEYRSGLYVATEDGSTDESATWGALILMSCHRERPE